jgi:hypothetical protein
MKQRSFPANPNNHLARLAAAVTKLKKNLQQAKAKRKALTRECVKPAAMTRLVVWECLSPNGECVKFSLFEKYSL